MTTTENADRRIRLAYATGKLDITGLAARLTMLAAGDETTAADSLPELPARARLGGYRRPYPAGLTVLAELAGIGDPRTRLRRAAQITDNVAGDQEHARLQRLIAAITAHVRYGASQVSCYAPLGITRRHFAEKTRQAPAALPTYGKPELNARAACLAAVIASATEAERATAKTYLADINAQLATVNAQLAEAALDEARRWHDIYAARRGDGDIARLVVARELRALTSGVYGDKVRAVRLAEDTALDPAWVSQIVNSRPAA